jgi:hypothetical protein
MTKKPDFNDSGIPYNIWIKEQFPAPHVVVNTDDRRQRTEGRGQKTEDRRF